MYQFNRIRPPLLNEIADIRGIDSSLLTLNVGLGSYETVEERRTSEVVLAWQNTRRTYELTRVLHWVIIEGPVRYESEQEVTIKVSTGYKEVQRTKFEAALDLSVSSTTGPPVAQLKADIKLSLKITQETEREWRSEVETTSKQTYMGETTYVTWQLLDSLYVRRTTFVKYLLGSDRIVVREEPPTVTQEQIDCVLNTYQDGAGDDEMTAATLAFVRTNTVNR